MRYAIFLLLIFALGNAAQADLDQDQVDALKRTQELLRKTKERNQAIAKDPKAKDIDAKAGALAGSKENKEEMYDISADMLEKIANETDGDPAKMQDMLSAAQKDPKAFYEKHFDEKQKGRVRSLANKIEKKGTAVPSN